MRASPSIFPSFLKAFLLIALVGLNVSLLTSPDEATAGEDMPWGVCVYTHVPYKACWCEEDDFADCHSNGAGDVEEECGMPGFVCDDDPPE